MAESKRAGAGWIAGLAGLAVVAIGVWLALGRSPERGERQGEGAATEAPVTDLALPAATPTAGADAADGLRISERGRLTLDADALPDGPLSLVLDLADEARGTGDRSVRIVSVDGRRIDATASPLPGSGSGVRLEIEPGFLSVGRYMIEIDTVDAHPLRIRRYVLELQ